MDDKEVLAKFEMFKEQCLKYKQRKYSEIDHDRIARLYGELEPVIEQILGIEEIEVELSHGATYKCKNYIEAGFLTGRTMHTPVGYQQLLKVIGLVQQYPEIITQTAAFIQCKNGNKKERESKNGEKAEGGVLKMPVRSSKDNWEAIKSEYDISKKDFGKKINFVSDSFKRKIIFRDVEHAFVLASKGFSKPALILAGGVIEELLRVYLEHKKIQPKKQFFAYIEACENNKLLKRGVSRLTDSIRDFRNLVHLEKEETKRHTISKATAKGAVASIFTIANDF